jgi:alpha-aminoadipate carrier protein LysW
MVTCPECNGDIDVDEEDIDEGETISCSECGADLRVIGVKPLELESEEEDEPDEEDDDDYDDSDDDDEPEDDEDWK